MPTPSPAVPTFKTDVLVDQAALNAAGSNLTNLYNYTMGGFRTLKPITAVRCTSGQSVSGSVYTQITWNTVDFDYDGMWSSGAQSQLTVQTAGVYWIQLQAAISAAPGGTGMGAFIAINGTTVSSNSVGAANVGSASMLPAAALVGLSAGATIYGFVIDTLGSTTISSANGGCRLTASWVSP